MEEITTKTGAKGIVTGGPCKGYFDKRKNEIVPCGKPGALFPLRGGLSRNQRGDIIGGVTTTLCEDHHWVFDEIEAGFILVNK